MRATQRQDVNESGALAQLGERNTGSVEVSGSIPLSSTKYMLQVNNLKSLLSSGLFYTCNLSPIRFLYSLDSLGSFLASI